MCIRKFLSSAVVMAVVLFAAVLATSASAQTWYQSTIQNGINGYDYELWNQNDQGSVEMKITGDNGSGANAKGGTFEARWSNTCNVLFRSGKKWGSNNTKNHTDIGQITFDFAATWNSPDDVKYLGIYGWAYYVQGKIPTQRENGQSASFSNQIEWYIIQDRGSYNPTSGSDCKARGEGTINGIAYDFKVCDRINQPMLTGNGNFKQFFSVPKSTGSHRQSGVVDVSAHFKAWHNAGMYMDGPLYEAAMKIESYKCNGSQGQGSGSGNVTKNILTIGGSGSDGNFTLTTNASPSSGGEVTKSPNNSSYAPNASVKLTATANPGYKFDRWSGDTTGTRDTITVRMNKDKTVTAIFTPTEGNTTNLIKNGTFTSTSNWTLNTNDSSSGNFAASGNAANITNIGLPSGSGAGNWSVQLLQAGLPLTNGQKYRLTFEAKAASARTIDLVFQLDDDPWTTYYSKEDIALTTEWQEFDYVFEMTEATDENGRIAFNFAGATPNVNIRNVKLVYATTSGISLRSPTAAAVKSGLRGTALPNSAISASFTASNSGEATLKLYNLKGNVISTLRLQTTAGRSYAHTFNTGKLPRGTYLIGLHSGGAREQTARILVK